MECEWYLNDHLGTPVKMITRDGTVVWSADYDAFGEATVTTTTMENNLRLPGQYYDAETGLHYNWHRTYDPVTGRYLQTDPLGIDGGDLNLYVYGRGNPVNETDPWGLHGPIDGMPENSTPCMLTGTCHYNNKFHNTSFQKFSATGSMKIGASGQALNIGGSIYSGIAVDINGKMCFVSTICFNPGTAVGVYAGAGLQITAESSQLIEGISNQVSLFVEGGEAIAKSCSVSTSGDNIGASSGRYGVGWGAAGGISQCKTYTLCP